MKTIQDLLDRNEPIENVKVEILELFNRFVGNVVRQDGDGMIIAKGQDLFSDSRHVKSPAWNCKVVTND